MTHLTIGVSSCLAGLPVRYDGRDKRDAFVTETLASAARLVLVCPEIELGLGTPRETLHLVRAGDGVRLISAGGRDITGDMAAFVRERVERLAGDDLDGCVLKSRSPSCGLGDAPVRVRAVSGPDRQAEGGADPIDDGRDRHADGVGRVEGAAPATTDGFFAAALAGRWPHLPVTTERALADADARDHFLDCARAYHELKAFFRTPWTAGALVEFHRTRAAILLAHPGAGPGGFERLLDGAASRAPADLQHAYMTAFMAALRHRPAPRSSSPADSDTAG